MMTTLSGKSVLLIIGGGIAAYKSLELVRRLKERGATVRILDCSPQVRLLLEVTVPHGIPGVEIVNTGRTGSKGGPRGC